GMEWRGVTRAGPGGVAILRVDAECAVDPHHGVVDRLVPMDTARAQLFGGVAQEVRDGGFPRQVFVAPAENPVALRGIEAQRRTGELQIAGVLWTVEEADGGADPGQLAARQSGGRVHQHGWQEEVRGAFG